jgi:site-specific DNA-methyltransferase (adenine-specific)
MTVDHKPMHKAINGQSTNYKKYSSKESLTGSTTRFPKTVLDFNVLNNDSKLRFHPNQKPVNLFEYLIRTFTNKNDLVLDNCSGSGTTAEAAINTHRNFICIERDPVYFKKSQKRIKQAEPQLF